MQERIRNLCRRIISAYGTRAQADKCCEEMAELATALYHFRDGKATMQDVITEIADVLFTATQMAIIFGEDDVTKEMERKMLRMEMKLDSNDKQR